MDSKGNIVIIEVVVAKNANTTQYYNEVELEKVSTCKEYLQVDELEKEATCVKIAQVHKDVIRDSRPLFCPRMFTC